MQILVLIGYFSYPISGLITAWGGANSHMAIRAGELGLPAVIGAGEILFKRWSSAKKLFIDCPGKSRGYRMKLIAVSQRIDFIDKREEFRDAIDERLNDFIVSFGGLPVPIPNNLFVKNINKTPSFYIDEWLNQIKPKGFVLSGGNDIGEYLNRDNTENKILNFARKIVYLHLEFVVGCN